MIALITPTGARKDQFLLCAKWMKRQDYTGKVLWIIVDDALPLTTNIVQPEFKENWEIIKVYPRPVWNGENTQGRNIKAGIDALMTSEHYAEIKSIFIIEDDDYYKENYLTEMTKRLGLYYLIGETNTIYYNVHWRQHCDNNNRQHASLFQTAFTKELLPLFINCLNNKFIDFVFWNKASNKLLFQAGTLAVGIKGMPGRGGIGAGHKRTMAFLQDPNLTYLKNLIGNDDAMEYERYYSNNSQPQHGLLFTKSN
jgi:hypothetical protein